MNRGQKIIGFIILIIFLFLFLSFVYMYITRDDTIIQFPSPASPRQGSDNPEPSKIYSNNVNAVLPVFTRNSDGSDNFSDYKDKKNPSIGTLLIRYDQLHILQSDDKTIPIGFLTETFKYPSSDVIPDNSDYIPVLTTNTAVSSTESNNVGRFYYSDKHIECSIDGTVFKKILETDNNLNISDSLNSSNNKIGLYSLTYNGDLYIDKINYVPSPYEMFIDVGSGSLYLTDSTGCPHPVKKY